MEKDATNTMHATGSHHTTSPCHVDITAMIRSLQRTEGLTDCFRRGLVDCDQLECAWRQYCLAKPDSTPRAK
jgi:hypothetical protein